MKKISSRLWGDFFALPPVFDKIFAPFVLQLSCEVIDLRTFYVDVYFLINFTVDILALYVAVRVLHARTRLWRLVLAAMLGAAVAVCDAFLYSFPVLRVIVFAISLVFCSFIAFHSSGKRRRIKFIAVFFTVELLLGGAVNFCYSVLDGVVERLGIIPDSGENRRALILAALVLISIGIIRLLIMIFTDVLGEKCVIVRITVADITVEVEAMLDSGNLVKDPMNMHPVLFIKPTLADRLVPKCVAELKDLDLLDNDYRKRIRLIPVTRVGGTHIMTGVRPDRVVVTRGKVSEEIEFTVAIDKEGGTYGGYEALLPLAVIRDAF